ncbi:MAG TPA: hypothetical protein QF624_01275 [Dehalococcoidia bacterium]|nr:hypothetical protein [Dehalococcoidia bacterium]
MRRTSLGRARVVLSGVALLAALLLACSDDANDAAPLSTAVAVADPMPVGDPVAGGGHPLGTLTRFDATVEMDLGEWFVSTETPSVSAGLIRFVARNVGGEVHEFALVEGTSKDGREVIEIEGISAGDGREIGARLQAGRYLLACLIVEVEDGAVEDHFALGMWTEFTVE